MKYETWLTYPDMSLAVEIKDDTYHCCEFKNDKTKKLNVKICTSKLELKYYLLSIPNPPKKEISALIKTLK